MGVDKSSAVEPDIARWRSAVAGVLAKSTRRDPDDLPAEPERLLDSPTYDGFPIRPLYTGLDALPDPTLPGQWPFVRGGDARRDVKSGWKVAEAFPLDTHAAAEGNGAVLVALTEGISALVLRVGEAGGVPAADLDRLLEGVFLGIVPVIVEISGAGSEYLAAADALLALLTDLDDDQRSRLSLDLGADPLTAPLSGRPAPEVADVVSTAAKVTGYDGHVRAITVDGPAFHNLGASASWELSGSVAAAVAYLRTLADSGMPLRDALQQIAFRFAADDDQFMTIAKLRAARQLWARVAEVVGEPEAGAATIHAVTSLPMMTQRDPWVNMLRTTLAAFSAGVGGADTVLVHPFDVAIAGGFPGIAASFARRIARNTQLLLLGGNRTSAGCSTPQGDHGSSRTSPNNWPSRRGSTSGTSNPAAGSKRPATTSPPRSPRWPTTASTTSRTGVPRSPVSTSTQLGRTAAADSDSPRALARYAAGFEALRDRSDAFLEKTGSRPQVSLLPLGPLAEHNIRTTFASNLLASGGIEAVTDATGATTAVICGTDARYATEASAAVDAARKAGVSYVLLAGPEKAVAEAESKPDAYLTAKIDAVDALSTLLTRLGA